MNLPSILKLLTTTLLQKMGEKYKRDSEESIMEHYGHSISFYS